MSLITQFRLLTINARLCSFNNLTTLINVHLLRQYATPTATKKDVELSYTTYPDHEHNIDPKKRSLIFLHGLFGAKGNLHSVSKHISGEGRKVVTYDARNHGESQHDPEMNYNCMADDLDGLIQDLNLNKPVVMGHSMGGKTAMTFALSKPDRLTALIVVDVTPAKSDVSELLKYAEAMKKVEIPSGISIAQVRKEIQVQLSSVVQNRAVLQFLLTNLREFDGVVIKWRMNIDGILNNFSHIEEFPRMNSDPFMKPTLFVFGANSLHYRYSSHKNNFSIKKLFPNVEITAIKEAGHFVHAEKPLEFVNIVKKFLDSVDKSSS
ncbi:unnamed protein product [Lymnaea stagnalis]|uniref:sn-1-specific diacylglycerol lipase ABHD11 n=1 Tax=Lymnaea stagnalis TaxID=6523 RepID=A0AAV2IAI6_LYMST